MLKVKICKYCSNLDKKKLKKCAEEYGAVLKIGCFGRCRKKDPELSGKFYGFIGKKLKVCSTQKKFLKKLKKRLRKANKE